MELRRRGALGRERRVSFPQNYDFRPSPGLSQTNKAKIVGFFYRSWFFENVSRKEAGKLLLVDENPRGTFLVRPSEHNPRGYSLSVKDWEEGRGHHVKHYKIKPLDNGGFFIATNQTFPTLPALVMAYSSKSLPRYANVHPR